MADYTGERFQVLDDECCEPGSPVDTWLENALQNNALYLLRGRDGIGWGPKVGSLNLNSTAGDRPYASVEWSTVLVVPWVIAATLTRVTIGLLYSVISEGSDQKDHDLRLELRDGDGRVLGGTQVILPNTSAAPQIYQATEVVCELEERSKTEQIGYLIVWQRSRLGGSIGGTKNLAMAGNDGAIFLKTSDFTPVFTADQPDAVALRGTGVDLATGQGTSTFYDVLNSSSTGDAAWVIPGPQQAPIVGGKSGFTRHHLTQLRIKGLEIHEDFDTSRLAIPRAAMRANTGVLSETTLGHARQTRLIQARPRCQHIGPDWAIGDFENDAPQWEAREYVRRWRHVRGDDAADKWVPVYDGGVLLDAENPRLEVLLWCCAMHLQLGRLRVPIAEENGPWDLASRSELATRGEWRFRASLSQLRPGDTGWAAATACGTGETSPQRFLHYSDEAAGGVVLFQQQSLLTGAHGTLTPGIRYSTREGQLFPTDLEYMQLVPIDIEVENIDGQPETTWPLRLTVEAQLITSTLEYRLTGRPGSSTINATDRLRMLCLASSAWQRAHT